MQRCKLIARGMGAFTFVLLSSCVFCQIPPGYYDGAAGLSGDALKTALHGIIDGHTTIAYDAVDDALKVTDEDTANTNNIICFYTGWSYAKSNFGGGASQWNREHVWSKSHGDFGTSPPEGTDLHHMKPTDVSVNSQKSNRDFDNGGIPYTDGDGSTGCYYTTYTWEPRDEVKGDVARMIFYMETRYEGGGEKDLEMVDYVNSAPNGEPYYGKESTLLAWHEEDPVDDWERNRNNIIYNNYQGNRNPFIDHPEYVNLIWGDGIIAEPSNHVSLFVAGAPTSTSIPLTWNDNDGAVAANGYLIKVNTTNIFSPPVDGSPEADETNLSDDVGQVNVGHGEQSYTWLNLNPNTTYYFTIYPYSNSGTLIDYKIDSIVPTTFATTTSSGGTVDLIISEVADPGDDYNARFVEIYNVGNTTVDFAANTWYLCRQANGSSWGDVQLTGTLNAGETLVVAMSQPGFKAAYDFDPEISDNSISGNGNDGYFLFSDGDHLTGTLIDAYGVVDIDGINEDWNYFDSKAVRKRNVIASSDTWSLSEWVITNADTQDMTPSAHKEDVLWQGTFSTNFNVAGTNWSGTHGFVPDASFNVTIQNVTNKPIVTRISVINKLTIEAGSSVEVNTGISLITIE